MGPAIGNGRRDICLALRAVHGLQEKMPKLEATEAFGGRLGLGEYQLQLVTFTQHQRSVGFGTDTDPIKPPRRRLSPIGFHPDFEPLAMQRRYQLTVQLKQGLPARTDHIGPAPSWPGRGDGLGKRGRASKSTPARPVSANKIGVAEAAHGLRPIGLTPGPEITARKAQENCGTPALCALPLKGVIEFLDRICHDADIRRLQPTAKHACLRRAAATPSETCKKGIPILIGMAVSGTGLFTPPYAISNGELVESFNAYVRHHNAVHQSAIASGSMAALAESSSEFIVKASGIKSRYVMDKSGVLDPAIMCPRIPERPDSALSVLAEIAVVAARDALNAADRTPRDIDGVLVACSNLQRAYPAIAIEVQDALGIDGFGFDMNVACSSATFGLQAAADMVAAGHARAILVCNPEICSGHLNFTDRDSHFIFGDVATAFVVEAADRVQGHNAWQIVSTRLKTKFSNNIRNNFGFLNRTAPEGIGNRDKLFVQEGRKVFKEVVPMVSELILAHLSDNNIAPSSLRRLWLHQANINMNDLIARKVLGRDPLPEEAPCILDEYANTRSAGSIIAFHKHSSDLRAGDYGHLCSFGAGYSVGSVILRKLDAHHA